MLRQEHATLRPNGPEARGIRVACDSARGFTESCRRKGMKFLCPTCRTVQGVKRTSNTIIQGPKSATYECTLDCDHSRNVTLNVHRPKTEFDILDSDPRASGMSLR